MVDYPGAISYLVDPSRVFIDQNSHSAIVLHGTGGTANQTVEALGDYFRTTPLMTSSHYGIGRDGRIAQYVLEKDGSAANCCLEPGYDPFWDQFPGNKNLHTLSVECVNDVTNSLALTIAQMNVLFPLVAYLVKKYGIPPANIKGHFSLEPTNRAECPGPAFPWDALMTYLEGATMNVPTPGWTYNTTSKVLTAPNGHTVRLGNAQFILNSNPAWDGGNVPLEEEHGTSGGSEQTFLKCKLKWEPATGVQYAPLGAQYLASQAQLTSAQAQITALQQQLAAAPSTAISQAITQANAVLAQLGQHAGLVAADIAAAQTALKAITPPSL